MERHEEGRERGTGGSETQDPMREGGGCGRITTGTRETERVGMGTSSCSEGRASQRGGWVDGWMDGWMGMETGDQHEEEGSSSKGKEGEASQTTTKKGRMGWDGTVGIVTD